MIVAWLYLDPFLGTRLSSRYMSTSTTTTSSSSSSSLSLKFGCGHGQASEMATADSGYIAPDNLQPSSGNSKADVYAFGVLLLEILTGRKPFDKYIVLL